MINTVLKGDCLEVLKTLEENSVDSIVTDPPYELGFMGKSWDSTGIANNVEMWKEAVRVLKPGGHLLAFSGTRTYHRMASAIEDAGFEVRDMIEWVYGSGFPKSLNIGKAVDKLQGNKREDLGKSDNWRPAKTKGGAGFDKLGSGEVDIRQTKGTSEWEGWGTALKPAHEPICMARKPLAEKTVALNVLKYGTGGINIDESRVGTTDDMARDNGGIDVLSWGGTYGAGKNEAQQRKENGLPQLGRFPANLIHNNSEEVRECFPNESERFFKSIIYQAKASKSGRGEGNNHPTVKPIALMEYLIKMVTPTGGIVLDPFTGSGSTLVAAKHNGYQYIGIEKEQEYIDIINKRLNPVDN
jgi:site-specific DNA-methyltransferase (adenine-specific)